MKYAVVFSFLGVTLIVNAYRLEVWWSGGFLAWAGISFALVAAAYVANAAWIFGKCVDGRMRVLPTLVLLPFRLLAEVIWWLNSRLSSEVPWHRVDDRLVVGRRLSVRDELPSAISGVLDLTSEFAEPRHLRIAGYRCLPMLDASSANPLAIARAVRAVASQTGVLYVHCAQCHGRTGLAASLILVARNPGMSPADALARLKAIHPGIGLSRQQEKVLHAVAAQLTNP